MIFSNKLLSQTLVQLCIDKGIKHIVISPGSRNAPLTIGFTENPKFQCYSIVDERCAAFFGLGIAQQLKIPVALICTSGSALLNYYPAIAEAYYSDIPLVAISADRPSEYLEIGDGQTIKQEHVFANHILYSAHCRIGEEHQLYNETELNIALNTAFELNGPVHINIPFSEPLYHTIENQLVWPQNVVPRISESILSEDINPFIEKWNKASKKMVLVGTLAPHILEQQFLDLLAADESVLVLTETTSNLQHPKYINSIDQLIAPFGDEDFANLQPEILLTFGGMVVSKKIKAFLRKFKPQEHWHIDQKKAYDTYFSLTHHFKTDANSFFGNFLQKIIKKESAYQSHWLNIRNHRLKRHEQYKTEIPFSDFHVFSTIFRSLPNDSLLQLGNSATIRYAQLFEMNSTIEVYCNRGTSGIDGSTSTAIGASVVCAKRTTLITGDLAFLYDSNALWNNYIPNTFRIVVVNNEGGGIFRILPGDKHSENFKKYFETKHHFTAKHLCEMFHFEYTSANDETSLSKGLKNFYEPSDRPKLLEIFTPSEVNDEILLTYFKFIK